MSALIDPADAIALARRYRRVSPEHQNQRLDYNEFVRHVLDDAVGRGAGNRYCPRPDDTAALSRLSELALALILGRDDAPDMAIYLTVDRSSGTVEIDYGSDVLELLAAAGSSTELLDFAVADLPPDLVRPPYWDGEEFDRIGLSELQVQHWLINDLFSAEIYLREIG